MNKGRKIETIGNDIEKDFRNGFNYLDTDVSSESKKVIIKSIQQAQRDLITLYKHIRIFIEKENEVIRNVNKVESSIEQHIHWHKYIRSIKELESQPEEVEKLVKDFGDKRRRLNELEERGFISPTQREMEEKLNSPTVTRLH